MAIALSITQSGDGTILVAHDDSTGITVTSRSLSIYDSNGDLLVTYNMGTNLTQNYTISTDGYFSFILTLNGNQNVTTSYLSTRFYDLQALTLEQDLNCTCNSSKSLCSDAIKALMAKNWAITYLLFGQGQNSQRNIDAANALIATSQNCNC